MSELKPVGSEGPERARIMCVGEAPGADEVRAGRPFVGKSGQKLRQALLEVGIDPSDVFFTNVCRHQPPGNRLEKFFEDGGVPNGLVAEGMLQLMQEIQRVRPNIIVALGNFPLWALTGKARWVSYTKDGEKIRGFTGIQDWRGSVVPCALVPGFKVISTYHPAYIIRDGMKDHGTWGADLAKASVQSAYPEIHRLERRTILLEEKPRILLGWDDGSTAGYAPESPNATPVWDYHNESQEQVVQSLIGDTSKIMTLDIEYIGRSLLCVGVTTNKHEAVVIPTETQFGLDLARRVVMAGHPINAQNSMFDASILEWWYQMPIMPRVRFDTMLAAHSANIELPKGLDYLLSIYTDIPYHKGMVDWKLIKSGKQSREVVWPYNAIDVFGQHEVMEQQIVHELCDPAVNRVFQFEMAMLQPLWEMSRRGILIDFDMIDESKKALEAETNLLGIQLCLMNGGVPINPRPSTSCTKFLYETMGLAESGKSRTGKPTTNDKTLAELAIKAPREDQRRAVDLVRKYRVAANLMSKFFDIEFDDDRRMRGHYDPTKTVTGRLASRKFYPTGRGTNQQNIPRDPRARRVFIADPKKVFCYADLERAESLVVAHITGDPRMLADHAPNVDAHTSLAAHLFRKKEEDITKDERYLGKKTRHAGNYMQGALTFMKNINQDAHKTGVSLEYREADRLIKEYRAVHPFLPGWWKKVEQELWRTRTLSTLLGRRRTFFGHIGSILPEAIAFGPQGTVGDTLNIGFLHTEGVACEYSREMGLWDEQDYRSIGAELREYGYENLMQIHDALAFQCWEKDVEKVLPLVRKALSIPLVNPRTMEIFTIPVEIQADLDPAHFGPNENGTIDGRAWRSNWGDCAVVHTVEKLPDTCRELDYYTHHHKGSFTPVRGIKRDPKTGEIKAFYVGGD